MTRCARRWSGLFVSPLVLAGCSSNPENDPVIAVFTVIAYAAMFGFFGFLFYRALFGPEGPR